MTGRLDPITAAALIGSFFGAIAAAGIAAYERGGSPEQVLAAGRTAAEIAVYGTTAIDRPG
ncbi:hypothetical protein ITP53_16045 [Nonomuraea sp. K274]|uniref:Uncharacterized protein n=1 Tax=Nonomuraea cypriaca TaxID=1187855 RepID=A0A931EWZ3_9ACTN|nr:hypothetical protein [Nonomuraea cypriaca]MBF8187219.1 hypothetical protein [Nonomuraea cypriaca]